jgi:hypothetical protein
MGVPGQDCRARLPWALDVLAEPRSSIAQLPFAVMAPIFAACSDSGSSAAPPTDALLIRSASHQMDLPDGEYEASLHVLNAAAQNGQDPDRADGASRRGTRQGDVHDPEW